MTLYVTVISVRSNRIMYTRKSRGQNTKTQERKPFKCFRCGEEGHSARSHKCNFCTDNHTSRDHICTLCNHKGHDLGYHKCSFCSELHGTINHVCDVCGIKGHTGSYHCEICKKMKHFSCYKCGDFGHCPEQPHCSLCDRYHALEDHRCTICNMEGHEKSVECVGYLSDRNKDLEKRIVKLEETVERLLNKLSKLSDLS